MCAAVSLIIQRELQLCHGYQLLCWHCVNLFLQSKPITPTSAPDEGDIFSEEGSYIRSDVHHATNGLHSDEELDLFTGMSRYSIAAPLLIMSNKYVLTLDLTCRPDGMLENIVHSFFVFKIVWETEPHHLKMLCLRCKKF